MSFPHIHYGNFGDEKATSSTKFNDMPLGQIMELPDGRRYRQVLVSATALVAGKLYQTPVRPTDTMYETSLVPASSYAAGVTSVAFTTGGTTAVTKDQYADGYLYTASSTGTGIGYAYKIKANNSAAAGSTTCTVTLYETDPLEVAVQAGTTTLGVVTNVYRNVQLSTADTVGARLVGVSCNSAAASTYAWLQTRGHAAVYIGGTVLRDGDIVVASTAAAGAVVPVAVAATTALLDTKQGLMIVGYARGGGAATGYGIVDLTLE